MIIHINRLNSAALAGQWWSQQICPHKNIIIIIIILSYGVKIFRSSRLDVIL